MIAARFHLCALALLLGGCAAADVGVERVETAKAGQSQCAAFGRVRIDVIEVSEVGGVLGCLIIERNGMLWCGLQGACGAHQQRQAAGFQRESHSGPLFFYCCAGACHQLRIDSE